MVRLSIWLKLKKSKYCLRIILVFQRASQHLKKIRREQKDGLQESWFENGAKESQVYWREGKKRRYPRKLV